MTSEDRKCTSDMQVVDMSDLKSTLKVHVTGVKNLGKYGKCITYYTVDQETGEVGQGGAVNVNLKWLRPCGLSESKKNNKWYEIIKAHPKHDPESIIYCIDHYRYDARIASKFERRLIPLTCSLMEAVTNYLLENSLLK